MLRWKGQNSTFNGLFSLRFSVSASPCFYGGLRSSTAIGRLLVAGKASQNGMSSSATASVGAVSQLGGRRRTRKIQETFLARLQNNLLLFLTCLKLLIYLSTMMSMTISSWRCLTAAANGDDMMFWGKVFRHITINKRSIYSEFDKHAANPSERDQWYLSTISYLADVT